MQDLVTYLGGIQEMGNALTEALSDRVSSS